MAILSLLDDRDLLSVCLVNKKAANLCRDESLWRNKFIKKYGVESLKYNKNRTWKRFYLIILFYLDKGIYDLNRAMMNAAKHGDEDAIQFFIGQGANL